MRNPESLIDIKTIKEFLNQLSKGDELKREKLRDEFIDELKLIRELLLNEMDNRNWGAINKTVARLKSVFHIIGENNIVEEINRFPDVNGAILNRVQKDTAIEHIVELVSFAIIKISDSNDRTVV